MEYIPRSLEVNILKALKRDKSVLLLGARQTGKTTLISRLNADLNITFIKPDVRQRYEKSPALLTGEVEALKEKNPHKKNLILLDEVQKIPIILDVIQDLIDRGKANFVLTGSSARRLIRGSPVNLLPGRVVSLKMDPLTFQEFPRQTLDDMLLFGSLPGIVQIKDTGDKELDLSSYVTTYLEEEIRAEAIVRNVGSFARFLELAASESGRIVSFRKLSQEIGVAHTTIASYFQILEDCLITERVEPIVHSKTRKKLSRAQKYLFFDLGVRRLAARESPHLNKTQEGYLFEQWAGLEMIKTARLNDPKWKIKYWRDPGGPEVDWILEKGNEYIPLEVKWTASPSEKDIKHLQIFMEEYRNCPKGYVICRCPHPVKLKENIYAQPWQEIHRCLCS